MLRLTRRVGLSAATATLLLGGGLLAGTSAGQAILRGDPRQAMAEMEYGGMPPGFPGMHGGPARFGHGPNHPPPPFGPRHLAQDLAALETELGIRTNQLDAWRDFTDNLQAAMRPPMPPMPSENDKSKPQAFALVEQVAKELVAKAKKAEALTKAVETLRAVLTPGQLERVVAFEDRMRRPPPPFGFMPPPPPDGDAPPPPPPPQ